MTLCAWPQPWDQTSMPIHIIYLGIAAVNGAAQSCKGQAFSGRFSLCIDGNSLPGLYSSFIHRLIAYWKCASNGKNQTKTDARQIPSLCSLYFPSECIISIKSRRERDWTFTQERHTATGDVWRHRREGLFRLKDYDWMGGTAAERILWKAVAEFPLSTLVESIDMNKHRFDLIRQQVVGQYYI